MHPPPLTSGLTQTKDLWMNTKRESSKSWWSRCQSSHPHVPSCPHHLPSLRWQLRPTTSFAWWLPWWGRSTRYGSRGPCSSGSPQSTTFRANWMIAASTLIGMCQILLLSTKGIIYGGIIPCNCNTFKCNQKELKVMFQRSRRKQSCEKINFMGCCAISRKICAS